MPPRTSKRPGARATTMGSSGEKSACCLTWAENASASGNAPLPVSVSVRSDVKLVTAGQYPTLVTKGAWSPRVRSERLSPHVGLTVVDEPAQRLPQGLQRGV